MTRRGIVAGGLAAGVKAKEFVMPKQKDLKRVVRARMKKTGESYTAARLQIVSKKQEPPTDYAAVAGMSDATISTKTGHTWSEWVEILDAFGAVSKPHGELAEYVYSQGVPGWWSQSVTVGYERIRGLREVGQRRSGSWEASKSRTFPVPADKLFTAFSSAAKRKRWLGDAKLTVRKATPPKSMRITWSDGTPVQFWFTVKGESKSSVSVQHTNLTSKEDVARVKEYWAEKLAALAEMLG